MFSFLFLRHAYVVILVFILLTAVAGTVELYFFSCGNVSFTTLREEEFELQASSP